MGGLLDEPLRSFLRPVEPWLEKLFADLRSAPAPLLEKYLGKLGYQAFAAWHSASRGAA